MVVHQLINILILIYALLMELLMDMWIRMVMALVSMIYLQWILIAIIQIVVHKKSYNMNEILPGLKCMFGVPQVGLLGMTIMKPLVHKEFI